MLKFKSSKVLTSIFLALCVTACGHGDKSKTQVIAKVNGDEISIHQLNFQMSRLGSMSQEQADVVSKKVLERLIDQQLVLQKAQQAKLDREPGVLQAIENAKREVLIQAYIAQQVSAAKKPSEQEINDFYAKNPELFEKRRLYRLQELAIAAGPDKQSEIEGVVRSSKSIVEVASKLKEKNLQFSANANVRAAEQVPLELLHKLSQMSDGEMITVPGPNAINVLSLAGSQEQSISKDKAAPLIEQYFLNQRKGEIAKAQGEALRAEAKIEYLGSFAKNAADKPAKKEEAKPVVSQPAEKKGAADSAHIEKGLSGL